MCNVAEWATAQCASSQPRRRTPARSAVRRGTGTITVCAVAFAAGDAERVGVGEDVGASALTAAPADWSTSRPKSRTSAARTASVPPGGVGAWRPSQVSVAAACPVSAEASRMASGSCYAYASG